MDLVARQKCTPPFLCTISVSIGPNVYLDALVDSWVLNIYTVRVVVSQSSVSSPVVTKLKDFWCV